MAMRGVVHDLVGVLTLKGGPGSGHVGHAGRPGSVGGSVPGVGGVSMEAGIASAIKRMVPKENRAALIIPATGLSDAVVSASGKPVDTIAYNPTTNTMVAGSVPHASLVAKYIEAPRGESRYDNFVKVVVVAPGPPTYLEIDIGRVWSEDIMDAWNKGFETAEALSKVGFPDTMAVRVKLSYLRKPGERGTRRFLLGEMMKEVDDGWIIESTLGALAACYKGGFLTL